MQKVLVAANKLPTADMLAAFTKNSRLSSTISNKLNTSKRGLKAFIKNLGQVSKHLYKQADQAIDIKTSEHSTVDTLWKEVNSNFEKQLATIETTIERWNSHTQLQQGQNLKRGKNSVFSAGIVSKANEMLKDAETFKRMVERSQQKKEAFRILGKPAEDLHSA